MTTNHLNRLDPALIRPGRVDVKQEIGWASRNQIIRMFTRFYPDNPMTPATAFADAALNCGTEKSVAQIQGHFMMFKNDPHGAVIHVDMIETL